MKQLISICISTLLCIGILVMTNEGQLAQGSIQPLVDIRAADQGFGLTSEIANPFESPDWIGEDNFDGNSYGAAVASAGDVNGDGYADIIVGAPNYGNEQDREGRAYAYYGSATGLHASPDWSFESDLARCQLGWKAASAGDINGDGYDDVLVSSEFCTTGNPDTNREGRVYLFLGSSAGLPATPDWVKDGSTFEESFGWSVASAGDVNGDGFDDVIIGAPWASYPESHEGRAYVFYGSALGLPNNANWITESNSNWSDYGSWVDSAGDVNGDGFDDVIIGHQYWSGPEYVEGRAYVYLGSAAGLEISSSWTFEDNYAGSTLGSMVAGVGDVNGDGYDDVMVGGKQYANPSPWEGIVYLFFGSASGPSTIPDWSQEGNQNGAQYGWAIAPAGDVNADGYDDFIIGSPWYSDTIGAEGAAFLYFGSSEASIFKATFIQGSGQADSKMGWSVSSAGDVNGDSREDIVVGLRDYDGGELNEGRAILYHGKPDTTAWILLPVMTR